MRRLMLAVLLVLFVVPLLAQNSHDVDLFGGFQYMHAGSFDGEGYSANTYGWNGSAAFHFSRYLASPPTSAAITCPRM